jgi:hypothetical protein
MRSFRTCATATTNSELKLSQAAGSRRSSASSPSQSETGPPRPQVCPTLANATAPYRRAVDLARRSGATFLVGLATLGLAAVLGRGGRVDDTLRGYRDVVDYFAGTGSWSHLWTALCNLAELLRGLSDPDAALLDAAADQADNPPGPAPSQRAAPDRAAVLDVALRAIERHLTQQLPARPPR